MKKIKNINLILLGVGGQGVVSFGHVIGNAFLTSGFDIKVSTPRGMAQRGALVISHIRAGDKVYSPLILKGDADIICILQIKGIKELTSYIKQNGKVFLLDREYKPRSTFTPEENNMRKDVDLIQKRCEDVEMISYDQIAEKLKPNKNINMYMAGVISKYLPLSKRAWIKAIKDVFPAGFQKMNLRAFNLGRSNFHFERRGCS